MSINIIYINQSNINSAHDNKLINLDNDFNYLIKSIYYNEHKYYLY